MIHSKRSQEGELVIDHRGSPGISHDIVLPGWGIIKAENLAEGKLFETGTATCSHCQVTIILNPDRTRPRGHCSKCHHYICDKPGCNVDCIPVRQVFDEYLEKQALILNIGEI